MVTARRPPIARWIAERRWQTLARRCTARPQGVKPLAAERRPREVEPDRLLESDLPPPVTVVAADDASTEDLLQRAALWDRAVQERDEVAVAGLVAPDFALELVQPVRNVMTREVWLEVLADYVIHEWDVEEQIVDVDGDYAAVLQRVRMQATVMGEDRSGIFVISDLWRRIDGEWRVWRRHSTPLSAGQLGGPTSTSPHSR